ncbi:hypothetical protein SOPP22_10860 [Shewanella sp. OPT22]|nr:hypothetical protein SOPP22_10860 [Shewanella sp. OPT22]
MMGALAALESMDKYEAKRIVESKVMGNHPDCSIMDESSKEFSSCFVFYFQSKKFIETGNFGEMYVGQGPVIVCKETGDLFETGSAYSTEYYVNAFELCGDPFGEPTEKISIYGWSEGASAVKAIKCIRKATDLGLSDAKSIVDQVLNNNGVVIKLSSAEIVESTISALDEIGFKSSQLWSNQC